MNTKVIMLIALVAMVSGYWISTNLKSPEATAHKYSAGQTKIQGFILETPKIIAMPKLVKDDGTALVIEDLQDHWSLMFFGYTHCPDICPTTMSTLAQSAKRFGEQKSFPDVFFVSVDPKRDSVEMLGEYVRYFDPSFTGVTGELKMLEALTFQTGIVFMQAPNISGQEDDYLVDHSASILLINPEGKLKAYLKAPHSPESILASLKILLN